MPTGQQYSSVATQAHLTAGISNSNGSWLLDTTSGFPATPFTAVFEIGSASQEIVQVTNVSGLTISGNRGVDGSSAQAHNNGATFTHSAIGRDFREARSHIDAATSPDASSEAVHGLVSGSTVVGTTDTQTLANKTMTSPVLNSATLNSPDLLGTISGSPTIPGLTAPSPVVTGSVTGSATYVAADLQNALVTTSGPAAKPLVVEGAASQTFNLTEWNVNGGSALGWVDNGGNFTSDFFSAQGLSAFTQARYTGAINGGPPSSGPAQLGDIVVDEKYGNLWVCTAAGTPGTWLAVGQGLLFSTTLAAPAATIPITVPSQGFKHLILRVKAKTSSGTNSIENFSLQLNGITSANYSYNGSVTVNTTAPANFNGALQTSAVCGLAWGNSVTTMGAGANEISIPNYPDTTFAKVFHWLGHATDGGSTHQSAHGGGALNIATNTAAVTSLTLLIPSASNFVVGTSVELIGVS